MSPESTNKTSPGHPRLAALSGFRVLIALCIFFFHWASGSADDWAQPFRALASEGYFRIGAMFALSGFVLTISYAPRLAARELSAPAFFIKRFLRLYPMFLLVMVFFVVLPNGPQGQVPSTPKLEFVDFALLQSFFPNAVLTGTATSWTLGHDMIFAAVFPFLARWLYGQKSFKRIALIVCAITVLCGLGTFALALAPQVDGTFIGAPLDYLLRYFPLSRFPDYLIGMAAGMAFLRLREAAPATRAAWGKAALPLGALWLAGVMAAWQMSALGNLVLDRLSGIASALLASVWVLSLAHVTPSSLVGRVFGNRAAIKLAGITFALFLIQLTEPAQWVYFLGLTRFEYDGLERAAFTLVYLIPLAGLVTVLTQKTTKTLAGWFSSTWSIFRHHTA